MMDLALAIPNTKNNMLHKRMEYKVRKNHKMSEY